MIYLVIGILVLTLLFYGIQKLSTLSLSAQKQIKRYSAFFFCLLLTLFFLRFGLVHFAIISGAVTAAIPFLRNILRLFYTFRFLRNTLGTSHSSKGQRSRPASPHTSPMTLEEARDILGVSIHATPEEIKNAYLRLIKQHHPDKGGSTYFTEKLNQARELLLGKKP